MAESILGAGLLLVLGAVLTDIALVNGLRGAFREHKESGEEWRKTASAEWQTYTEMHKELHARDRVDFLSAINRLDRGGIAAGDDD
jgi:hypothetical protein